MNRSEADLGRSRRSARSTGIKTLLVLIAFYLLFTITPFADFYAAPLYQDANPRKSDVIVLLSSGQIDSDWLTPDASQRVLGALKLYREGYAPRIISSGSQSSEGKHQAELQAVWLIRAGVPREAIIIEGRSTRTRESAVEVSRLMAQNAWKTVVIVTSQMDVPRVRLVFSKLAVQPSFLAVPEFRKPEKFRFFRSAAFDVAYHATYEYLALVLYKIKGWI